MLLTFTGGWLLLGALVAAVFCVLARGARSGVARRSPHDPPSTRRRV